MKIILAAIAVTSTLAITQGCASQIKSEPSTQTQASASTVDDANNNSNHHAGHETRDSIASKENSQQGHSGHDNHGGHGNSQNSKAANAAANLSIDGSLTPKNPVNLVIDVKDKSGKAISNFDISHEELMHLIVVSDDLQFFNHIHPTYKGNGRFEIKTAFPQPGNYTLFTDYKPAGKPQEVSVLKAQVPGQTSTVSTQVDTTSSKNIGNTKVNFNLSQPVKADEEVHLVFNLQDAKNNQPIKDLQPYLGELGHLVIVKQSSSLTSSDYIHNHAMKGTPPGEVHFITAFPEPGKYKLWGQFKRNGEILTADFWVNVQ